MYKYEFVKIELKMSWKGKKPKEDYHEVVKSYAKRGWRLVQVFAPATAGHGAAPYFELIFEQPL